MLNGDTHIDYVVHIMNLAIIFGARIKFGNYFKDTFFEINANCVKIKV